MRNVSAALACARPVRRARAAPPWVGAALAPLLVASVAQAQAVDVGLTTKAEAPDGRARLNGGVSLSARPVDDVSTKLDLSVGAGEAPGAVLWPGAAPAADRDWRDLGAALEAAWSADPAAVLKVQLAGGLKNQPLAVASAGETGGASNDRLEQSAGVTAALKPARGVDLQLSAKVDGADDQITASDAAARMLVKTRDGQVESRLHWAARPDLTVDAGARLSSTSVFWRESATAAQDYVAVQPDVAATYTLRPGSTWRLDVTHAVTPLDAARFVTLARTGGEVDGSTRLEPDQEWRLQGEWTQALPADGRLKLAVTRAHVESATELVRLKNDVEGPGSVPGGERSQVDLALTLPLKPLGLRAFALETSGSWRTSQVQDPLTGAYRRASGEAPYETRVALSQTLPLRGLKWGVDTRSVGPQSYYGLSQVTSADADQTLGAFVEYHPVDFTLRLQLDNLTGGERRWQDAYYAGDRDLGALSSVVRRTEGGPSFGLSLKKPL